MLTVRLRNMHLLWPDYVTDARVYLDPSHRVYPLGGRDTDQFGTTDAAGQTRLVGLAPGPHNLWIVPKLSTDEAVGQYTATGPEMSRIFRGMQVQIVVDSRNAVTSAVAHVGTKDNGTISLTNVGKDQVLEVRLRPIWMKSPYFYNRGKQKIDMIVIHKTGDSSIGSSINQFLNGGTSAHYIVGRDGHAVKMVLEQYAAGHASHENEQDQSHWGTQTRLAWRSIGIENVGTVKEGFTEPQYKTLIALVQELMKIHEIPRHRVVAHSDILTDGHQHLSDDRIGCPGYQFEWAQLESANPPIGLARTGGARGDDSVDEFFEMMTRGLVQADSKALVLKPGDFDAKVIGGKPQPSKFGGKAYTEVTGTPIAQIQTWLKEIGYSVGPVTGEFNRQTARASRHFQVHFEGRSDRDTIDQQSAALIRDVHAANPKAD